MPTVLRESHPIARKEHICMLCGGKIKRGEKYYRQTCVYDTAPYEWTEHEDCREIVNRLQMFKLVDYDDGLSPEVFAEIIYDYILEHYPEEIANELCKTSLHHQICSILTDLETKS